MCPPRGFFSLDWGADLPCQLGKSARKKSRALSLQRSGSAFLFAKFFLAKVGRRAKLVCLFGLLGRPCRSWTSLSLCVRRVFVRRKGTQPECISSQANVLWLFYLSKFFEKPPRQSNEALNSCRWSKEHALPRAPSVPILVILLKTGQFSRAPHSDRN